jgi:hypothetical protein
VRALLVAIACFSDTALMLVCIESGKVCCDNNKHLYVLEQQMPACIGRLISVCAGEWAVCWSTCFVVSG